MLVGRQAECDCIARLVEEARQGKSGVLVVRGEPGIGKSALLARAIELSQGMRVLRARGVESEAAIPFSGLLELLRRPRARSTGSRSHRPSRCEERLASVPPSGATVS